MKIYISGKITGTELKKTKAVFGYHAAILKEDGYSPVNPFHISPEHPDKTWHQYMIDDIAELMKCDAIYMITGWGQSKGARIEYAIAKEMGLKIYFSDTYERGHVK